MKTTLLLLTLSVFAFTFTPLQVRADGDADITSPATPPAATGCEFSHLVGKKDTEIDRTEFGDRVVRSLKPGQMITMEYLEGRINLQVDDDGVIVAVTCG
jgi:hypothetical protein